VVICDEPASITDAYALIKVLSREHDVQRFQILANQTAIGRGTRSVPKIARVCDRFLNVSLEFAGSIPFDDYLRVPCNGKPRSSMRTRRLFRRSPQIWHRRPISGLCPKGPRSP